MEPLISVIVPIYNVEQYLDRCIKSIVNQTYRNLEIILVDDGSPDSCPDICDKWAEKDDRIVVIHQKNAGLSAARNSGLDMANGEFISFVDSDDALDCDMLAFLYGLIEQNDADISRCSYQFNFEDGTLREAEINTEIRILEGEALMNDLCNTGYKCMVVWNKLYKRDVIGNLRYDTSVKASEDYIFNYFYFKKCKKMVCHDISKYEYTIRDKYRSDRTNYNVDSYHALKRIIQDGPSCRNLYYRWFMWAVFALHNLAAGKENTAFFTVRKEVLSYQKEIKEAALFKKDRMARIKLLLLRYAPHIYQLLVQNKSS